MGRDKGGGEFERFMFTSTEGIYMMPKQEGNESFHDNVRRNLCGFVCLSVLVCCVRVVCVLCACCVWCL